MLSKNVDAEVVESVGLLKLKMVKGKKHVEPCSGIVNLDTKYLKEEKSMI